MHCQPRPNHCQPRPNHCMKPTTTQVMPAQVHPTQHNIVEKTCEYIVPEVYPTHTTNVTNHVYKHVKSFPQTQSFEQNISNQQFVAPGGSMGPGPVAGASTGPGMMGPGMMGGPVAGAMSPQGPGMMGQMHGHKPNCNCGCRR